MSIRRVATMPVLKERSPSFVSAGRFGEAGSNTGGKEKLVLLLAAPRCFGL